MAYTTPRACPSAYKPAAAFGRCSSPPHCELCSSHAPAFSRLPPPTPASTASRFTFASLSPVFRFDFYIILLCILRCTLYAYVSTSRLISALYYSLYFVVHIRIARSRSCPKNSCDLLVASRYLLSH